MYTSVNWVTTGPSNGLLPGRHQTITSPRLIVNWNLREENSVKFQSKHKHLIPKTWIYECRLQNVDHFARASVCHVNIMIAFLLITRQTYCQAIAIWSYLGPGIPWDEYGKPWYTCQYWHNTYATIDPASAHPWSIGRILVQLWVIVAWYCTVGISVPCYVFIWCVVNK